ncbi:MAG: HYR domain-containing protein, partial [Planctomycetota bacterium]
MLTDLRSLASALVASATLALGASAQSVVTDKPTYDHGETAIITAVGFQANEQVTFTITCPTCIAPSLEQPWTVQADSEGEIVTAWVMSPAAPFGSELEVGANGSSGAQANFLFSNALGSGRVASVTPTTGGCVQQSLPPVTGTELWYVEEYESYRIRLTNVTDVGAGGTAPTIQVIVNSQNTASQCVTATRISTGVYEFVTDMPPNACEGYGILYGTSGCAAVPAARVARRSDGIAQQSRLRVAFFGAGCSAPVQDNTCTCPAITLSCPSNITACADAQSCNQVVYFNPQVSGGCPDRQVTSNPASGSVFPIGTTTVTVTATDFFGTQQCTFTVTVNDCTAPTISCPSNVTACADNGACSAVVNFNVTGVDGCSTPVTVVSNPSSGSSFPIGTTTVQCSATDAAGNVSNCSFTVTVNDCENPTVQCPADITQCNDAGACGAVVTFSVPGNDNCAGVSVVATPASGSVFPVGTTVVNATATDAAGNTASCSFNVTVNDCENPTVSVPSPITVCNDAGACGAIVTFTASGNDNCAGVSVTSVPASGSSFPIGTTTVTTTATDAAGNSASSTFTVTVNDCEDPVVTCPTAITQCNDIGACGAVVTFQTNVTDNCPGATVVATPASGSTFPVGTTVVNVVGTDAAGRT